MNGGVKIIFLVLLISVACEKNDVLPQPPPETQTPAPRTDTVAFKEENHVVPDSTAGSDTYQYGEYHHMPYRYLIPKGYDSLKTYPLHIFLHGISERGNDNEQQLLVGGENFQADSVRERYPAFIIFPQCPESQFWFDDPVMDTLRGLIDTFASNHSVDQDRISIGGFSMGAYGTFAMVARNPKLFQAAVAISGEGEEKKASLMTKPDWEIFAGGKDKVVPKDKSWKIAKALQKAGASVTFKSFEEADHYTTWVKAFAAPGFFSRIFRAAPAEKPGGH
ncbi:MAG TPA: dienelactone hydrolase family protein [Chryseosolibacter sp.]|jgi:predicted peptidase|nr:dienelactone hydrolase family protein [Chryseosolibacter sp.]